MLGLLSSVKRRMSSREGQQQPTTSTNLPLATGGDISFTGIRAGGTLSSSTTTPAAGAASPARGAEQNNIHSNRPNGHRASRSSLERRTGSKRYDTSSRRQTSEDDAAQHSQSQKTSSPDGSTGGSPTDTGKRQHSQAPSATEGCSPSRTAAAEHTTVESPDRHLAVAVYEPSAPKAGLLVARQDPAAFFKLPLLKDTVTVQEHLDLLKKKLALCRDVVFDFRYLHSSSVLGLGASVSGHHGGELYANEKEAKRRCLNEILEYINDPKKTPPELIAEDLIQMVYSNLFRPLPPASGSSVNSLLMNLNPDETEPMLDPGWSHLQLIYEILLRFVMCSEVSPKVAKRCIDTSFVLRLLDLFGSEDPREREYLKTIMHRVYGKVMALRGFVRKAIQNVFYRFIHERECHPGVSELLEILGSIINGFAQPLKEEHKQFLQRSMIPLHKTRNIITFHQQLTYCMTQYIEKDYKLVEPIIIGLLRYWPLANTPKEVLFLNEVEEILELTPSSEFQKICVPLFHRLAQCIRSPHFQVSERVLFFWNNSRLVKLITAQKAQLYPIIIAALTDNSMEHWNETVQSLTLNVCKLISDGDAALFKQISDEYTNNEERRRKAERDRSERWRTLQRLSDGCPQETT